MPPLPTKPTNRPEVSPSTLVFGCGYLGHVVAKRLVSAGQQVWATTRDPAKGETLRSQGIAPVVADWTDPQTLGALPAVSQILVAVSYDRKSDHNRRESQVGGLRNLLDRVGPEAAVCYISTTGVYHQTDGDWVDESSPTEPTREGGIVHLEAERLLAELRPESAWTILRLAGIYGPGRVPRAADVIAGRPIAAPESGFLNLIHVEDAAEAVLASWHHAKQRLYLVADDHPVVRGEFYREIARQSDVAAPKFVQPAKDAPVSMRSESNKRVSNQRMKRDLVETLRYPSYREGLESVL